MKFDEPVILAVIDSNPKTAREVVDAAFPGCSYTEKTVKLHYVWKVVKKAIENGTVKSATITNEHNNALRVFYTGEPEIRPRRSELDVRLMSTLHTRTYMKTREINQAIYGDEMNYNTGQIIYNHLIKLNEAGLVETKIGKKRGRMWRLKP